MGPVRPGAILIVAAMVSLSGCARPVGDFGRAEPSVLHDRVLPGIGAARAGFAGSPVSDLNLTDEEVEMHDRVWRFLVAPHSGDWFHDVAAEWQRTRLTEATDWRFAADRYYEHLRRAEYNSSPVRYHTVRNDIDIDIATLPTTMRAVCAVIEMDQRRATALAGVERPGPDAAAQVAARRAENHARIAWFTRALRYRHLSYATALDRLLVETPHEEARTIPPRLDALEAFVLAAEAGRFCPDGAGTVSVRPVHPMPSRFEMGDVEMLPPK